MLERNIALAVAVALSITVLSSAYAEPVEQDRNSEFYLVVTADQQTTELVRDGDVPSARAGNPITGAIETYSGATEGPGTPLDVAANDDGVAYAINGEPGFANYPGFMDASYIRTGDAGAASVDSGDDLSNPVTQDEVASPLPGYGFDAGLVLPPLDEGSMGFMTPALAFDEGAPLITEIDNAAGNAPGSSALFRTTDQDYTAKSAYSPGTDQLQYNKARTNARTTTPSFTGAGTDLASVAAAAAAAGLFLLAPLMLYHRIKKDRALDNKTRKAVYDAVMAEPGAGVQELADRIGVSYSTTAYHLSRLCEERMLVTSSEGGSKIRYYKNGGASEDERRIVSIMKDAEAMKVLELIEANPWCYRAEIAEMLKVSSTSVNWHLKKLLGAGLVKEQREGRNCYLYADRQLIERFGELREKVGMQPVIAAAPTTGFDDGLTAHAVPATSESPFAA